MGRLIFLIVISLLILTPLPYGSTEAWSSALWELIIFSTMILWALYAAIEGRKIIQINPLCLPLAGLLIIALIQMMTISYDSYTTFHAALKIFAYLCFFLLFSTFVNTLKRKDIAVKIIISLCVVIALIGISQNYIGKLFWELATFGPFVNRNHFAGFLEMGVGLAGGMVVSRAAKRETLALYISAIIVMSAGIILTGSRGGILSLIAEIVFLAIITIPTLFSRKLKLFPPLAITFAGVTTILLALLLAGSEDLIHRIKDETEQKTSINERYNRIELWKNTTEMIKDHSMLGIGLGAYPIVYTRYDRSSGAQRVEQSHNDYLQIAADAGIAGIIVAISFLLILFVSGYKASQSRDKHKRAIAIGALTGCFAIVVHSVVEFNLQITSNAQLFLALAALTTEPFVPAKVKKQLTTSPVCDQAD